MSKAYRSCITFSEKTACIVELAGCINEKFDSKNFEHIKNCLNYIVKIPNHIRAKENTLLRLSYKKTTEATAIMVMHEEDEIFGLLDTLLQLKDMIMEAETEMFEVVRDLRKENDK
ncbi:hypothetical protein BDAP_000963 [Binucleata daphniae]